MTWEQHRYAVERARDYRRKMASEINEANQGVSLQGEAQGSDAELLDEVADFLQSLEGSRAIDMQENPGHAFIADWNKAIATLSNFCGQWDIPKPTMVFHPRVNMTMRRIANSPISDTIIYADIKIRFGQFEQADVLR